MWVTFLISYRTFAHLVGTMCACVCKCIVFPSYNNVNGFLLLLPFCFKLLLLFLFFVCYFHFTSWNSIRIVYLGSFSSIQTTICHFLRPLLPLCALVKKIYCGDALFLGHTYPIPSICSFLILFFFLLLVSLVFVFICCSMYVCWCVVLLKDFLTLLYNLFYTQSYIHIKIYCSSTIFLGEDKQKKKRTFCYLLEQS